MIRNLVVIAVAGFVLCLAALAAAFAIGGPDAIARGGWHWAGGWDNDHWDKENWDRDWDGEGAGPVATRTFAWDGSDRLSLSIPADVTYTQADGPAKVVVTGPQRILDRMDIDDGRIVVRRTHWGVRKVRIAVTAPNISRFHLSGANRLTIENYNQPSLSVDVSGASEVSARGRTDELDIDISGAGEAEMGQLATRDADVDISGAGEATVAPIGKARLQISGMGEINLTTEPSDLETDISGAGRIHRGGGEPAAPAPPAAPKTKA
ncbi:GIN domain-containing protein [Phenylobacterium sp. VNQ135]|uniref:GIN domain-containing protein n=1 Tax=Phenylobacterium sp. VNQ135 TaxID=3400922 RepID=UPI003C035619